MLKDTSAGGETNISTVSSAAEFPVPPFLDVLKHTDRAAAPEHQGQQHKMKNQNQNQNYSQNQGQAQNQGQQQSQGYNAPPQQQQQQAQQPNPGPPQGGSPATNMPDFVEEDDDIPF